MITTLVIVTGSTYPIRERLKAAGGKYANGSWTLPAKNWENIKSEYYGANKAGREIRAAIDGCTAEAVHSDQEIIK